MQKNLSSSLEFTFRHEGLYSCVRTDGGNWTGGKIGSGDLVGSKYGISAPLLCGIRHKNVNPFEMKALSLEEAKEIAQRRFWNVMHCSELPTGVDLLIFDHGFNCGTRESVKTLQKIIGVSQDGVVGPKTMAAFTLFKVEDFKPFLPTSIIQRLQKELKIEETWDFDAQTIQKIKDLGLKNHVWCCALANAQYKAYQAKVGFKRFGTGWLKRLQDRLALALESLRLEKQEAS